MAFSSAFRYVSLWTTWSAFPLDELASPSRWSWFSGMDRTERIERPTQRTHWERIGTSTSPAKGPTPRSPLGGIPRRGPRKRPHAVACWPAFRIARRLSSGSRLDGTLDQSAWHMPARVANPSRDTWNVDATHDEDADGRRSQAEAFRRIRQRRHERLGSIRDGKDATIREDVGGWDVSRDRGALAASRNARKETRRLVSCLDLFRGTWRSSSTTPPTYR